MLRSTGKYNTDCAILSCNLSILHTLVLYLDLATVRADLQAASIRWSWGIAALGRRQVGVAVGLRNFIVVASLQPGAGSGVGGKGR